MTLYWFKALHIIAMVAWFAGLFYMFRLYVYHSENKDNLDITNLLKVMERRLYRYITIPAMIATWIFGLVMLTMNTGYFTFGWVHAKLTLVVGLTVYTFYIGSVLKKFANDNVYLTSKQCRVRNEIPTLFLILIVVLATIRPF